MHYKPTESRLSLTNIPCKQIQALSKIKKTLNSQRIRGVSPVGEQKVYGGKNLPKSQGQNERLNE